MRALAGEVYAVQRQYRLWTDEGPMPLPVIVE